MIEGECRNQMRWATERNTGECDLREEIGLQIQYINCYFFEMCLFRVSSPILKMNCVSCAEPTMSCSTSSGGIGITSKAVPMVICWCLGRLLEFHCLLWHPAKTVPFSLILHVVYRECGAIRLGCKLVRELQQPLLRCADRSIQFEDSS